MSEPTHGGLIVKSPQYVEEVTYGVFPTNPAMSWIGTVKLAEYNATRELAAMPHVGEEDSRVYQEDRETYGLTLDYFLQNSTLAKYGVNAQGGGAGSIDKTLSILASAKLGGASGTETFIQLNGVRVDSITLSGGLNEKTLARVRLTGKNLPIPSTTSPIGSGSFATDPGGNPWNYYDGGASPVTIGGVSPDVKSISVEISRQLSGEYHVGETKKRALLPGGRNIQGTITLVWKDTVQYANLSNASNVTISWVLKSATSMLTLTNARLRLLNRLPLHDPLATIMETYAVSARTVSLT